MSDAFPSDLKYTKDHEWTKATPDGILVGITAFAVEQLGDITLVSLDVKVGDSLTAGKAFGTIESVKTLSDLYAPVAGKIVKINADLNDKPELVNEDCYGKAWMIELAPTDPAAAGALLDAAAYKAHVDASG
jgi:glycine cleavage system H protein